ncbi:MAG: putative metal-dependent hydrolase [Flavobacterium sp.]|nr:MAG: putative metal-dependent hydrolase [Flavobacterium sp.]
MEKLRYPIGKFEKPTGITSDLIEKAIAEIENFPLKLRLETQDLSDDQLDTPYRPEGWTVRQVVHHCADSHMNAITRFKLALTEDKPTIKPYEEALWAELADSKLPISPALQMLDGIHGRLSVLLKSLSETDLRRTFIHPEHGREIPIEQLIFTYAWHGNHHLAHITSLKKRMRWS